MTGLQPRVPFQESLVLFSHAKDYTGWHSMKCQITVKHGRALPTDRLKDKDIDSEKKIQKFSYSLAGMRLLERDFSDRPRCHQLQGAW